ncbi:MAG TPA: PfkB family carbohydrate kinase [Candidatus Polarisedimenticolia bacterium]|jgi:rfaE bifunctional protein kinase chain/domain
MKERLRSVVERFADTRVVVLGDLVLDEFLLGEIARVSREAPVLIIEHRRLDAMPGGGANAANNVRSLGGRPVPIGIVGDDEAGRRLTGLLEQAGIDTSGIVAHRDYVTPTKTRVLAGLPHSRPQQIVRIDRGALRTAPAGSAVAAAERARAMLASGIKGVLLSDYGYDLVTPEAAVPLVQEAGRLKIPLTCDSRHRLRGFTGVTAVTPNLEEAEEILGVSLTAGAARVEEAGRRLLELLVCRAVLVTRGSHGMTLLEDVVRPFDLPVFGSDQVADVTGAGDTVIAAFTLALAAGATFRLAAILADIAAGLVVMKRGTATITSSELLEAIDRMPAGAMPGLS